MEFSSILKFLLTFFIWKCCTCVDFAGVSVEESEDGKSGKFIYKTPELNDEEALSQHMPEALKCDACQVVAYQLSSAFNKTQERKPLKHLAESEIFDITDTVCSTGFDQYGIKEFQGKRHLTGPGMPSYTAPGIMQGGGRWPTRLQAICSSYIEELGEEDIYDAYRQDKSLVETLCHGRQIFGYCGERKKNDEL